MSPTAPPSATWSPTWWREQDWTVRRRQIDPFIATPPPPPLADGKGGGGGGGGGGGTDEGPEPLSPSLHN